MREEMNKKELDQVNGGNDGYYNWTWGTVHDVVDYGPGSGSRLTLRDAPGGNILYDYGWQNGDGICVACGTETGDWIMAQAGNGQRGWVNRNYVWY